jgi:hypothetical protein
MAISFWRNKTSLTTATKLKAESKCGEMFSYIYILEFGNFFQKHGNIAIEYFLFIFIFRILAKFCTQKMLRGGSQ